METIAAIMPLEQPAIKYESPYSSEPPVFDNHSSPLKRRYSETANGGVESDEKRARIEVDQQQPQPQSMQAQTQSHDDFDFDAIIAQAAANAAQEVSNSLGNDYSNSNTHTAQPLQDTYHQSQSVDYGSAEQPSAFSSGYTSDPHLYMRILSLPILESLSTQILATLAQGPYSETIKIITQPESELGQAYATLKSLFDQTKKIYSQQKPFLSADELNIREPEHRATIRTTNLATFVSSVFGGQDVGFYELNDHFIETFVPDGGELQKEPGLLYLNLKTQMYLSAVSQEEQERTKEETLDDLFPASLADTLRARHPGSELSASEIEFTNAANARREYLQNDPGDVDSISALSEQYAWEDFLRNLSDHLKEAYEPLIAPYMRRHALTAPPPSLHTQPSNGQVGSSGLDNQVQHAEPELNLGDLDIEQATRAATEHALQSVGYNQYNDPSMNQAPQQHHGLPQQHTPQMNGYQQQYPAGAVPYHTQTAPTQVLYEQARQAAVAKASPHSRRPGLPSQRRPWSTEEENALMAGLDQVKGPHWSQILALYGAKGQVSEILKDRNQVQLKDKARNLKLFFLKSNIEVPYYLQCVTGELKTRAPSQAARKEAEERARAVGEEEQARFHGILTLAAGIQDQSQQPQNGSPQQPQHMMSMDGLPHSDNLMNPNDDYRQHREGSHREELRVEDPNQVQGMQGLQQQHLNHSHSHSHSHSQTPNGAQTPQQVQQQNDASQLAFEDALGARLMESLEDHDKRAASVGS